MKPVLESLALPHLLSHNIRAEANYVRDAVLADPNPVLVFCHRDFNHPNILLQLSGPQQGEIRLIDFDYSCYFYRGTDLGRYITICTHSDLLFNDKEFISDQEMRQFIEYYREECGKIHGHS